MSRLIIAYLLVLLLLAAIFAMIFFTRRFNQYRRELARGNRKAKPVWKPFWL